MPRLVDVTNPPTLIRLANVTAFPNQSLKPGQERVVTHSTKQIGNAAVEVSPDGKVVAVAGWDGSIRLFSTKTFKSLGTLGYHRDTCQALAFPTPHPRQSESLTTPLATSNDDQSIDQIVDIVDGIQDVSGSGLEDVHRWMASGGKDKRVAIWELMDFRRPTKR